MKRFIIIVLLLSVSFIDLFGQGTTTVRLQVVRGARLDFIFNSLSKYKDGISYPDFTQLNIYFNDTIDAGIPNPTCAGWELTLKAVQTEIDGDMTAQDLDLSTIEFTVKIEGIATGTTYTLSNASQVIASGVSPAIVDVNKEVLITYNCGTLPANSLLNKMPDYYYVDLEFNLTKIYL